MAETMKCAVIGCGAIARRLHIPDLATTDEAEIVALCDKNPAAARAQAEQWAPGAAIYSDHKKMLKETPLDCVVVTLPNVLHCPVTLDALKAGCHVLVEKPMAASLAEAKKMCETAEKMGKTLMVNQCQRLAPPHLKAKEVLDSGILGKILYVTAMFGHEGPDNWEPSAKWFFKGKEARFGAMADLGVHKADLVRYLAGKEIRDISAYMAQLEKKGSVEDNFVACFTFEDGAVGTLGASWTIKGRDTNFCRFHCANGTLELLVSTEEPLVAGLSNPACTIYFEPPPPVTKYEGTWGLDAGGRFVRACMGLEAPFCSGEDGLKSLAVILAAEQSAKSGKSVTVKYS